MTDPQLHVLREQLDALDEQLISLLAERFKLTDAIGQYKRRSNIPSVDATREKSQMERVSKLALEYGLNPRFATRILRSIINEVVKRHELIRRQSV